MCDSLKDLRLSKNLTQKDIAENIGISRSAYTLIENGDRNPSLKVIRSLVQLLGTKVTEIFF
ncbi:putative transcriptional regulator [Orenia metallireducens]|uniref:Putative transcriptional regulator n=1 Tax=Orenia metallireducens TaxID=1413210 RepID=A0A285IJC4_9FIRM|nr:helix-turn-helix transcriptional regulator [Orenia metallireducens]PRX29374.1 putative transcriptional regulator [Orenia metallireducens]SNY48003.1 putative transcriptional regulator [Orenia metallireducens]